MTKPIHISCILLSIVLTLGCHKKEEQQCYIENGTQYKIYLDIYETLPNPHFDAMTSHIKLVTHAQLQPGARLDLLSCNLKDGANYVYDWYSTDYKHSGWMRPVSGYAFNLFNYHPHLKFSITTKEKGSNERMICLGGDGIATLWKTVDAYDRNGKSIWNTLGPQRSHSIAIKYYTMIIDSNWEGPPVCIPIGMRNGFYLADTDRFWLNTNLFPDPDLILTDNASFLAPLKSESTDTLFYLTRTRDYSYDTCIVQYREPIYKIAKVKTEHSDKIDEQQ